MGSYGNNKQAQKYDNDLADCEGIQNSERPRNRWRVRWRACGDEQTQVGDQQGIRHYGDHQEPSA